MRRWVDSLDLTNFLTYFLTIVEHINVYEAKTRFSHWVDEAQAGRSVVICKRNQPVALLSPLAEPQRQERRIGLAKGTFTTPATFFDPLPDDLVRLFEGRGS